VEKEKHARPWGKASSDGAFNEMGDSKEKMEQKLLVNHVYPVYTYDKKVRDANDRFDGYNQRKTQHQELPGKRDP